MAFISFLSLCIAKENSNWDEDGKSPRGWLFWKLDHEVLKSKNNFACLRPMCTKIASGLFQRYLKVVYAEFRGEVLKRLHVNLFKF
jgi:hypothetical protein